MSNAKNMILNEPRGAEELTKMTLKGIGYKIPDRVVKRFGMDSRTVLEVEQIDGDYYVIPTAVYSEKYARELKRSAAAERERGELYANMGQEDYAELCVAEEAAACGV